jgi:tetratricopeptide (TPR) repeat protein
LIGDNPGIAKYQSDLAATHNVAGGAYRAMNKPVEELASYQRALAIQEGLVKKHPKITDHHLNLAGSYVNLANLQRTSDWKAALGHLNEAVELLQRLLKTEPDHTTARRFLRNAYRGRAGLYDEQSQPAAAAQDWEQALALEDGPARISTGRSLSLSLARAGQHQKAAATAEGVSQESKGGAVLYDLAKAYAISVGAATRDESMKLDERTKLSDAYAAKALTLLHRAAKAGYFGQPKQVNELEADADFDSLRSQPDFRSLMEGLRTKAKP